MSSENFGATPDYAQQAGWYQRPAVTKDVDTVYI